MPINAKPIILAIPEGKSVKIQMISIESAMIIVNATKKHTIIEPKKLHMSLSGLFSFFER